MPLMKNVNPTTPASPSALKAFFLASRPKTWIASLSPVLIGTAMSHDPKILLFIPTLLFSLFIQIGTNFANDYFDFVKGADTALRNGPKRATQEGWIAPKTMWQASLVIFGAALLIAIPLIHLAGLWSLFIAIACVSFGILYTGGPKPLGYLGLGEVLVFVFFGPIATCGTYFLQTTTLTVPVCIASLAPGLLSCSLLIANNLRDEKTDRLAHKNTLIVRFGKTFGTIEYTLSILAAAAIPFVLTFVFDHSLKLLLSILPFTLAPIHKVFSFRDPLELIAVLQKTSFIFFLYTLLFAIFI